VLFLKLFERIYGTSSLARSRPRKPIANWINPSAPQLDCLYQQIVDDLDKLLRAVGLKAA
jgi:hypothetical protein